MLLIARMHDSTRAARIPDVEVSQGGKDLKIEHRILCMGKGLNMEH